MPHDWSKCTMIPIWKNKGDIADCSTYWPIWLMSHALKIFERVLERRLRAIIESSSNQCGFVKGADTADAIHTVRIVMEKYREERRELHAALLDMEKVFGKYLMMSYGYYITQLWMQCDGRSQATASMGSLYADDVVLMAENKELEEETQRWKNQLGSYGLKLNTKKTEYMEVGGQTSETIYVDEKPIKSEYIKRRQNIWKYLGSCISGEGGLQDEISARNACWMIWRTLTGVLCDRRMPV
ncbi:unnamed protein product [Strongylus vulgaris]|uniref:Reverse transcriptase domain-containing protein n=1 Tax=Strongylus vulgaris TaxID=40348 RepID=A0A3P7J306_STRVU|nr:unnamed protein product [Strongylus vulgaris]